MHIPFIPANHFFSLSSSYGVVNVWRSEWPRIYIRKWSIRYEMGNRQMIQQRPQKSTTCNKINIIIMIIRHESHEMSSFWSIHVRFEVYVVPVLCAMRIVSEKFPPFCTVVLSLCATVIYQPVVISIQFMFFFISSLISQSGQLTHTHTHTRARHACTVSY